jgi:hypothetical protein
MSDKDALVTKPLYDYGQFRVCVLCSSIEEPKEEKKPGEIKINIRGSKGIQNGAKLNINPNKS